MHTHEKIQILNQAILVMTIEKNDANKSFLDSEGANMPLVKTVEIEKECNEAIRIMENLKKKL